MTMIVLEAPAADPVAEPIFTPTTLALSGLMVAAMSGFYLLLSAVPAHVATLGGDFAAGLATSALMATTIAGELLAPRLIARFGRHSAMAAALLVLALPCLTSFSDSLMLALLSCATRGLGLGVLLVAACGLAAALAPPTRRAEALGIYGVASAIPAILCVPLGAWSLAEFGSTAVALVAAASTSAGLACLAILPGRSARPESAHPHCLPALRGAIWPSASLALGAIVVGATVTFLPLAHREVDSGTIMLALLVQGLTSAIARWVAGRPVDRHGPQGPMILGIVLAVCAILVLACTGSVAVLVGMALSGVAFGILQSASLAQLLSRATENQADGASAVWNAAYDAGLGLGGLVFGALAATTGYAAAFVASGASLAALAFLAFHLFEARRS